MKGIKSAEDNKVNKEAVTISQKTAQNKLMLSRKLE
jgi:hypothetical protein